MKQTFVLAVAVVLAACDGGGMMMNTGVDTMCAATPAAVTRAQLQSEIVATKCMSCHFPDPDGTGPMLGGTGEAYGDYTSEAKTFEMVNKTSLYNKTGATSLKIVDADTSKSTAQRLANSTLWLKISSTKQSQGFKGPNMEATGATMPQGMMPLSAAELQKFKDWICNGAP